MLMLRSCSTNEFRQEGPRRKWSPVRDSPKQNFEKYKCAGAALAPPPRDLYCFRILLGDSTDRVTLSLEEQLIARL